ncbi:Tripartite ATP-independent periplasmic transporter, DctQ component [Shimia sp. SK013]|nr:Tripartite ATP-independent periplasmic transporter, DctQ component [Shimia sp. SK013]
MHPGDSLFGVGDIIRAIQTGQVPIGGRFTSAHANEAPLLGWDNLPFIATSYDRQVWEHLSHYYKVNAWLPRSYVMVNTQVWDGLDAEVQAGLQKTADETSASCAATSFFALCYAMTRGAHIRVSIFLNATDFLKRWLDVFAVIRSMYFGWATATEAAAVGVLGALILAAFQRSLTLWTFLESLMGETRTSALIALYDLCELYAVEDILTVTFDARSLN